MGTKLEVLSVFVPMATVAECVPLLRPPIVCGTRLVYVLQVSCRPRYPEMVPTPAKMCAANRDNLSLFTRMLGRSISSRRGCTPGTKYPDISDLA